MNEKELKEKYGINRAVGVGIIHMANYTVLHHL